jgi:adenylate cyclase
MIPRRLRIIPLDESNSFSCGFCGKPGSYDYYSFSQVLNGEIPADYFAGKIILIGPVFFRMLDEYIDAYNYTHPMNGVEIHANIIQNIHNNNFKRDVPVIINMFNSYYFGHIIFSLIYKVEAFAFNISMFFFY